MKMPDRPETWAWLTTLLAQIWPNIYAALLAGLIAGLRIIYGGGRAKQALLEALICGLLALAVSHGLHLIGQSLESAPFWGGVIGLLGIELIRSWAKRIFKSKLPGGPA